MASHFSSLFATKVEKICASYLHSAKKHKISLISSLTIKLSSCYKHHELILKCSFKYKKNV